MCAVVENFTLGGQREDKEAESWFKNQHKGGDGFQVLVLFIEQKLRTGRHFYAVTAYSL